MVFILLFLMLSNSTALATNASIINHFDTTFIAGGLLFFFGIIGNRRFLKH
jgi:hypothetical protein